MTVSRPATRRLTVLGAFLAVVVLVGAGFAVNAATHAVDIASAASATAPLPAPPPVDPGAIAAPAGSDPVPAADPTTTVAPATTLPSPHPSSPTTTVARPTATPSTTVATAATPTTIAAPPPAPAKLAPGQRLNPSSADVAAAIVQLHQRIPLFAPTDPQLRAFADAVCTSFDQGQNQAQVQSTVQQAVSHVQGASLSAADAQFAVGIVVQLRCPGYAA